MPKLLPTGDAWWKRKETMTPFELAVIRERVRNKIIKHFNESGLTIAEFAKISNVGISTLVNFLERRSNPMGDTYHALIDGLGLTDNMVWTPKVAKCNKKFVGDRK